MSKTGRLGLPYILQAQAQKEVTHNQALMKLDVFINTVVEAIVETLPTNTNDGSIYIINNELAQYNSGSWTFYSPFDLMEVTLRSTQAKMIYDGNAWVPLGLLTKDTGEYLRIEHWQEDVALSGSSINTKQVLPDHSSVMAVNIRVLESITGVASFSVGVDGDIARYGSGIGINKDTTNISNYLLPRYANNLNRC